MCGRLFSRPGFFVLYSYLYGLGQFFYLVFDEELQAVGKMISVMPVYSNTFRAISVLLAGGERAVAFLIFEELHYFFCFIPVHMSCLQELFIRHLYSETSSAEITPRRALKNQKYLRRLMIVAQE